MTRLPRRTWPVTGALGAIAGAGAVTTAGVTTASPSAAATATP